MSKVYSVSQSKKAFKGKRIDNIKSLPREGSRLRMLYDAFIKNKGIPINPYDYITIPKGHISGLIPQLMIFYGLEIKSKSLLRGKGTGKGKGTYQYTLIGEWFGIEYRDYTKTNMEKEKSN